MYLMNRLLSKRLIQTQYLITIISHKLVLIILKQIQFEFFPIKVIINHIPSTLHRFIKTQLPQYNHWHSQIHSLAHAWGRVEGV